MPVSDYLFASGIKVHAGEIGKVYPPEGMHTPGQIIIGHASLKGMDENLFALLKLAVDSLGLAIRISSVDTGIHVAGSRHYLGQAVDINEVSPVSIAPKKATLKNPEAKKLARWFIDHYGFTAGHERPGEPCVLFGPVHTQWNETEIPHVSHIHISISRRKI